MTSGSWTSGSWPSFGSDAPSGWWLSIDFGTSYTTAVVASAGGAELVEFDGAPRMPSAVMVGDSGDLVVGWAAERQLALAPDRAERTPKRRLGDPVLLLGDRPVRPVEAVAALLRSVHDEARRRRGGEAPSAVVLTHPVRWAGTRTAALQEAASQAGLGEVVLLPEPIAAAIHFADDRVRPGDHVAVYDLGGGTFDTAVLQRTDEGFVVVGAPGGDDGLGGEDFDERLYHHLAERLPEDVREHLQSSAERIWRKAAHDLRAAARTAKEALSANPEFTAYIGAPVDRDLRVTREEFEELVRPDVERTVTELEGTVLRAGLRPTDLAAVDLAGGSSRIPLVTRLVAERLAVVPQTWGDPKAVVALGAARAHRLAPAAVVAEPAHPLPEAVGPYEVLRELGRGGMGVVYLARQRSVGRLVAVKALPVHGADLAARLQREAAVLGELQHPHVATVLDVGTDQGSTYVVMPFMAGGTVSHVLDRDGRLTPNQAVGVVASVAEALDATHRKGFLHRDVKPSNLLLNEAGDVYLADFGLAASTQSSGLTTSRAVLGTIGYTAPEVVADQAATPASDVYALGVCAYQLLTGRMPFTGSNMFAIMDAAREGRATPLRELAPDVPEVVADLVMRAMAVDPADRPTDLRELAAALRGACEPEPLVPAPPRQWGEVATSAPTPGPASTPPPEPAPARHPRGADASDAAAVPTGRRVAAMPAWAVRAGLGMATVAALVVVLLSFGGGGAGPAAAVEQRFPATTVDGVEIVRTWALDGPSGEDFLGTLTFTNETSRTVEVRHVEVIPKSVAEHVDDLEFDPEPEVLDPDPVVAFTVEVPAEGSVTAAYRTTVAADGRDVTRLQVWAADHEQAVLAAARHLAAEETPTPTEPETPSPEPTTPEPTTAEPTPDSVPTEPATPKVVVTEPPTQPDPGDPEPSPPPPPPPSPSPPPPPPNGPPQSTGGTSRSVAATGTTVLALPGLFADPDGDAWYFTSASVTSTSGGPDVSVSARVVPCGQDPVHDCIEVDAFAPPHTVPAQATVAVTATDPGGSGGTGSASITLCIGC